MIPLLFLPRAFSCHISIIPTMAPIHTLADLEGPPQYRDFKFRNCPGMRSCWYIKVSSYNPFNRSSTDERVRRTCMIVTLGSVTLLDFLWLYRQTSQLIAGNGSVLGLVVGLILNLIGFFFVASCLTIIGDAESERTVMGRIVVSKAGIAALLTISDIQRGVLDKWCLAKRTPMYRVDGISISS